MPYSALSVDLPWSLSTRSRTVIAAWSGSAIDLVTADLDGDGLERCISEHTAQQALVVLDVPIDGCADLCKARPWRALDSGLAGIGIPILPSYKSGTRGPDLRDALLCARPDLKIFESYPYAVLRVLWGIRQAAATAELTEAGFREHVTRWDDWWTSWPPRYKRARRIAQRREAVAAVGELLASSGEEYRRAVRLPLASATTGQLARLSDEYDALLGLEATRALLDRSPWSWTAVVEGQPGSIVSIAPPWLREAFAKRVSDRLG